MDKIKVLIITDKKETNLLVKNTLQAANYEIVEAYDGSEGLSKARAELPRLIIIDISSSKVDGLSIIRELKENSKTKAIAILVLAVDNKLKAVFEQVGVSEFIVKPIRMESLFEQVKMALLI